MQKPKPIEPGCLAIIVRAKVTPENNGKVVTVVRKSRPDDVGPNGRTYQPSGSRQTWLVERDKPDLWLRNWGGTVSMCSSRVIAEECLLRIDGPEDEVEETTNQERKVPCT